jgi:glycerol-3-phosphate dehydrogenase
MKDLYDVFVIGGGINGCGVARDASGRGYSVYLAEKSDIASGTSSASSKLIHGGLRYLESYDFSLVRKALKERDVLVRIAPHIVRGSRFLMPYSKGLRPVWMLRLGMLLYDNLYFSKYLKRSSFVRFASHPSKLTLLDSFTKGFEYSDCQVDDSRLTLLNAIDAKNLGSIIKTRTIVKSINQINNIWEVETLDLITGQQETIKAKVVVNATGPWIDKFLRSGHNEPNANNIRLVKGSHIVVKKMFEHNYSYIFQNEDGRIFFAIPWEGEFTFIGTTDVDFNEDLDNFSASEEEITYICESVNKYFKKKILRNEVVGHWSGVRPLFDDSGQSAQKASRDYIIKEDSRTKDSALINVFGGKLTTFRQLSEDVVDLIDLILGSNNPCLTFKVHLPGGDFHLDKEEDLMNKLSKKYEYLDLDYLQRLFKSYGTRVNLVLKGVSKLEDLGINFGKDLYQSEVDYLMREEFALFPDDITERRTKLYLFLNKKNLKDLDKYMAKNR